MKEMTYKRVEEMLNEYKIAKMMSFKAHMRLEELKLDQRYPKAIEYSDMPKAAIKDKDLSDYMVKLEEAKLEIKSRWQQETQAYMNVLKIIDTLPITTLDDQRERYILKMRYLNLYSWSEVCKRLNYSRIHADRLRRRAIYRLSQENWK